MSLFVKHVADKQQVPVFSNAAVDITMPSPCTASSHTISVKAFPWYTWGTKTRSNHVTRNALAARNNEAYGQVTTDSRSIQSFCIIKNTGHGNFVVGRFHTRARKWNIRLRLACVQSPLPHRHSFSVFFFFFWEEGEAVYRLSGRIIHLQTVRQNWRIKSGGLFIQN